MSIKNIAIYVLLLIGAGWFSSCTRNPKSPGRYYMPDMRYSQAYETYVPSPFFDNGLSARKPVDGTIARGTFFPEAVSDSAQEIMHLSALARKYFTDDPQGYELAGKELSNPLKMDDQVLKNGEKLFNIYCSVCHGLKGDGKGPVVESGAFPPVPDYRDRLPTINEGKMFHAVTFGKNLMGSYSSQLNPEERWEVIYYIQKLAGVGRFAKQDKSAPTEAASAN